MLLEHARYSADANEICDKALYGMRQESKSLLQKPSTPDPFADEVRLRREVAAVGNFLALARCGSILRKMVLKQLDKPYKPALELQG